MTEHRFAAANQGDSLPWNETAANQGISWEKTLAEEAATTTKFLQKLVNEVESNRKALLAQQRIIEAQAIRLKVLDRISHYLQGLEVQLDKLRNHLKEVMSKINPEWDLNALASKTMFDEVEAETENLVNQYLGGSARMDDR